MRRLVTMVICFIPINFIKIFLLNLLGNEVSYKSRIGISLVYVNKLNLSERSSIGSFNFLGFKSLELSKNASIKKLNYIKGPLNIRIEQKGSIQFLNEIRCSIFDANPASTLQIGINSFITRGNYLDLTRSIKIGENSILAGKGTQLWTHGFYHADKGHERVRIDGSINIGNNVYVGSSCIFNPGVSVGNSIHIGAGSVISKNLDSPGMYVSQGLRHFENSLEKIKSKLQNIRKIGNSENWKITI